MELTVKRDLTARYLGKGARLVSGIILHDTAGSGTHNDTRYLMNPGDGRKVSVDFTVERDGSVWQLNPDLKNNWTFHAGRATRFRNLRNQAVTKHCIGIEIVQKANLSLVPMYPPDQVKAVAFLCADLCKKFNLKREDITTHARVITDGSRSDPRKFPFNEFWSFFNLDYSNNSQIIHIVKKGDTLWAIANKYQTKIEKIKELNDLNDASNNITPGQELIVSQ